MRLTQRTPAWRHQRVGPNRWPKRGQSQADSRKHSQSSPGSFLPIRLARAWAICGSRPVPTISPRHTPAIMGPTRSSISCTHLPTGGAGASIGTSWRLFRVTICSVTIWVGIALPWCGVSFYSRLRAQGTERGGVSACKTRCPSSNPYGLHRRGRDQPTTDKQAEGSPFVKTSGHHANGRPVPAGSSRPSGGYRHSRAKPTLTHVLAIIAKNRPLVIGEAKTTVDAFSRRAPGTIGLVRQPKTCGDFFDTSAR
jgi:hypothetical protein